MATPNMVGYEVPPAARAKKAVPAGPMARPDVGGPNVGPASPPPSMAGLEAATQRLVPNAPLAPLPRPNAAPLPGPAIGAAPRQALGAAPQQTGPAAPMLGLEAPPELLGGGAAPPIANARGAARPGAAPAGPNAIPQSLQALRKGRIY